MSIPTTSPGGIDPDSPQTSYQQLAQILAQQITSGQLATGSKMPPERDLVQLHSVSRATVRSALQVLEQQRLIRRVRGRGTYVAARPNPRWLSTASTILFLRVPLKPGDPDAYDYEGQVYEGACQTAEKLGFQVRLDALRGYKRIPLEQYQSPRPDAAAGVIVCGTSDDQYISMFRSEGVPIVVVDYWTHDLETDCVAVDVESEAYATIDYLAERGHTSLGFTAIGRSDHDGRGFDYDPDIWRLLDTLRRTAQRRRIDMDEQWVVLTPVLEAGPERLIQQMLSLRFRPTALLCFDGQTARCAFKAASAAKLRCPEDISIITRGLSVVSGRNATTFVGDPAAMGGHAVRLLLERRSGQRQHAVKLALPSRLVIGATTGPAPRNATSNMLYPG